MKIFIAAILALGLAASVLLLAPIYTDAPVDPAWEATAAQGDTQSALVVRYTGTSTLLFSDGETRWMIDGWFSRPGPLALLAGRIAPDLDAITSGLANNRVTELAAVLVAHSHYDHAMDAPEVARRTGARLMGSESTANIGRGWGLAEEQIEILEHEQPVTLGKFVITPLESRHFEFADAAVRERALSNPVITEPLVPPVSALDYRLGKAYAFLVDHPAGSFAVVASAGYREGLFDGHRADVVFLGIGGLGSQTEEYRQAYWTHTVDALSPLRIVPIHYDSLTAPAEGPFEGPSLAEWFLSRGVEKTLPFLQEQIAGSGARYMTLPRFEPVVLFE